MQGIVTRGKPLYNVDQEIANVKLVREFIEASLTGDPSIWEKYIAPHARLYVDVLPTDPVASAWPQGKVHTGPSAMKKIAEEYVDVGFDYDMDILSIYACGPVVIVARTDTRKEEGKPDWPFPAVGVFAVQDGMIVEWSDYYR